ncbi:MAG TPA: hypothetical protein VFF95_22215 [Candidatus Binatus sp.]|nr:hypothetical protein [Candidatus Binatus sp.]
MGRFFLKRQLGYVLICLVIRMMGLNMDPIQVRRILTVAFLVTAALSSAHAQTLSVQKFQIHVTDPAYTGLPVWIYAELGFPLEIRYPYGEDPRNFGPNKLEVKHENRLIEQESHEASVSVGTGPLNGSIAPASSPRNRLPLHLRYALEKPGIYSVRWTEVRHRFQNGQMAEEVVAQSDWLDFEVRQSTPEQRKEWFERQRARVPSDAGEFVGDLLPSLLAYAPNPQALQVVLEQLYSTEPLIHACALGSLRLFREEDIRSQTVDILHHRGPNEGLAYEISWHAPWFQDQKEDIVRTVVPYLHARKDWQVAAALKMLVFVAHPGTFHWPPDSQVPAKSDQAVLEAAPELMDRSSEVSQILAEYLGGIKSPGSRHLLWQVAARPEPAHEQALIALTWIGEVQDLPRLAELLIQPGDADKYGRDIASLPYSLVRAYGDAAVPYLERAVSESPYAFVRTQSAEELALRGRPVAFRFFLDAVENGRFYKPELVGWLKTHFSNEMPASADDATVIAFLKARLQQ